MENAWIADRLEAFASLLELADANPYTARAYRRAADTIRGAPVPVPELVRNRRVRELRGIGPGIEARLRELVETGEIAELTELERELAPGLVGLGRYLGLTARRSRARPRRDRSAGCCSIAPGRSSWASRPRSTARRPATCGGGATHASCSPSCAPRGTRPRCWRASPPCRRSSPSSSRTGGARSV